MLEIKVDNINSFLKATFLLIRFHATADLKCSPGMFSLVISSHFPRVITALQIMPPFFTNFNCDQIYQWKIPTKFFHKTMKAMKRISYSSMTLSLGERLNHLLLGFYNSRLEQAQFHKLSLLPSREDDVGKIDYGTFVAIDSQVFKRLASLLDDFTALVIATNTQVKFYAANKEITLGKEGGDCIIGGIAEGEETRFFIAVRPITFFRDLTHQSKRIWLFNSASSYSIMIAPIVLYAQICVYFPRIE